MPGMKKVLCLAILPILICLLASTPRAADAQGVSGESMKKLVKLGGRGSIHRSKDLDAMDQAALKDLFHRHEKLLLEVLQDALGDADAAQAAFDELQRAIDAPGAAGATIEEMDFPTGGSLEWMGYRNRSHRGSAVRNVLWDGPAPFKAWKVSPAKGSAYSFVIPKICLNLASYENPTCDIELSAEQAGPGEPITVRVSGSPGGGGNRIASNSVEFWGESGTKSTIAIGPDGGGQVNAPKAAGKYTFQSTSATDLGQLAMCRTELFVKPVCALEVHGSPVEAPGKVNLSLSGNFPASSALKVTGKDASGGSLESFSLAPGGNRDVELPHGGEYVFTAAGDSGSGNVSCRATATATHHPAVCSIVVDPTSVIAGQSVKVDVSGMDAAGGNSFGEIKVTATGNNTGVEACALSFAGSSLSGSQNCELPKVDDYTFVATAQVDNGDNLSCTASATAVCRGGTLPRWTLRGFGAGIAPQGSRFDETRTTVEGVVERTQFWAGGGSGLGASIERRFTCTGGLELGVLFGQIDGRVMFDSGNLWETDEDSFGFLPITLGWNFHLTPNKKADFFLGPVVALVKYGSADFNVLGRNLGGSLDDDFAFGARLGLDVFIGDSPWAFHAGLLYLNTSSDFDNGTGELDVDPLIGLAGFAYNF